MIATGVIGAGLGAYQTISSAQQAKEAKSALENYNRQTLKNVAEDLQVSTLGADLQREEQARLTASQVEGLRGAGTRGIVGGLGRVEAGNQLVNQQIGVGLDEQQKAIDRMIAGDDANIRGMQENRELGDISALSSQFNAGQQGTMQGMGNMVQSAGMLANNLSTPEGSARREAWRDYKAKNPNASRSTFMKQNPKNGFSYGNVSGQPSFQGGWEDNGTFRNPPIDMSAPETPMNPNNPFYTNYGFDFSPIYR